MAYNTGSLYAGENYVRSVLAAALDSTDGPAVPSVKLLQSGGFRGAGSSMPIARRITLGSRRADSDADARLSPLLAQRPSPPRHRDLTETLEAAVSR